MCKSSERPTLGTKKSLSNVPCSRIRRKFGVVISALACFASPVYAACIADGATVNEARTNYAAQCTEPRKDCDPVGGRWYCASQNITQALVDDYNRTPEPEPEPDDCAAAEVNVADAEDALRAAQQSLTAAKAFRDEQCSLPADPEPEPPGAGIGRMAAGDLLILEYDIAPDPDDYHAMGAGRMVADYYGLTPIVVVGTAGDNNRSALRAEYRQGADAAWADYLDADAARSQTTATLSAAVSDTLAAGSSVWIAAGGPMDFLAGYLRDATGDLSRVHVAQHNKPFNVDKHTTSANAQWIAANTSYHKIPDGNIGGNGTGDFNNPQDWVARQFDKHPVYGGMWTELFSLLNPYRDADRWPASPNVKFDGSDIVELLWLTGDERLTGWYQFQQKFGK